MSTTVTTSALIHGIDVDALREYITAAVPTNSRLIIESA